MKRAVLAAVVLLAIGAGWASLAQVLGQGSPSEVMPGEVARPFPVAKPRAVAPEAAPVVRPTETAPEAAAPEVEAPEAAPVVRPARVVPAPSAVTPPPPVPDVPIPPIPEVDKEPFKPGPTPVRQPRPDFLAEGKRLFNREGRMETDAIGRPVFVFDSGEKPMRILENSWREYIETRTDRGKKKAHWRISGVVMVYEGTNFLLLTKAVHLLAEEENL
jgi:hypothetical protein